jgi:heme oxygenase
MLTRRHAIPVLRGVPEAMGWLYVCERMTLQHEPLRNRLAAELPIALELGGSYLASYAGTAAIHWRELGAMLDQVACTPAAADRIVAGASEAFESLASWLSEQAPAVRRVPRLRAS